MKIMCEWPGFPVILCSLRNVSLRQHSMRRHTYPTSPPTLGGHFHDCFRATVLFLGQTDTKGVTLQSCEVSHMPLRALMGGARQNTHLFVP